MSQNTASYYRSDYGCSLPWRSTTVNGLDEDRQVSESDFKHTNFSSEDLFTVGMLVRLLIRWSCFDYRS